jgi:hypothetical protein
MGVYVREFKKEDLKAFKTIEQIAEDEEYSDELAQAIEDSHLAITGVRNGKIIGCGGVHPVENNPDHGELWLKLSHDCKKHKIEIIRWLNEGFKIISNVFPFKQLNATLKHDFPESIKLVKFLGLVKTQEFVYDGQKWLIFSKRVK